MSEKMFVSSNVVPQDLRGDSVVPAGEVSEAGLLTRDTCLPNVMKFIKFLSVQVQFTSII